MIAPVDSIQPLTFGALDPALHGMERDAESTRHLALWHLATHGPDHRTTLLSSLVFASIKTSQNFSFWYRTPGPFRQGRPGGLHHAATAGNGAGGTSVGLRPPSVPPAPFLLQTDPNQLISN